MNCMRTTLLVLLALTSACAAGANTTGGEIYVHGTLLESACWLETDSPWQDMASGQGAIPRSTTLRLHDCPERGRVSRGQPGYNIRLIAPAASQLAPSRDIHDARLSGLRLLNRDGQRLVLPWPGAVLPRNTDRDTVALTLVSQAPVMSQSVTPHQTLIALSLAYQ